MKRNDNRSSFVGSLSVSRAQYENCPHCMHELCVCCSAHVCLVVGYCMCVCVSVCVCHCSTWSLAGYPAMSARSSLFAPLLWNRLYLWLIGDNRGKVCTPSILDDTLKVDDTDNHMGNTTNWDTRTHTHRHTYQHWIYTHVCVCVHVPCGSMEPVYGFFVCRLCTASDRRPFHRMTNQYYIVGGTNNI